MIKRFSAIIAIICLLLLVGCENVEYIVQTSSEPEEETSTDRFEQLIPDLPDVSITPGLVEIETETFTIATDDTAVFYQDENASGTINTAVLERNELLNEMYGTKVVAKPVEPDKIAEEIKAALESEIQYCDLMAFSASTTLELYLDGLLEDFNTLPSFDVESSYFDPKISKSLATNSTLYLLPDPTALVYDETYVMFYNRDLISAAGAEDPETLVMQGKWTWDKYNEIARASAEAFDKHSANIETDVFGFSAYYLESSYPLAMWTSCGQKLVDNTYKNAIELSMDSSVVETIATMLRDHYNTKGKYPLEGTDALNAFEEGRAVFFCNKFEYFYALRDGTDKGANFGFVPMPKYDEEQTDYHCLVCNDARVFSIPKTLANASEEKRNFVSVIISSTCAAGDVSIRDAFINTQVALYLNTNAETVMLQAICDSITFDFATLFGSQISEVSGATTDAVVDFIGYGSKISSTISNGRRAFNRYSEKNFT